MDEINKIIKSKETYLYQRIINNIDKYQDSSINEFLNHTKNEEISLIDKYITLLEDFLKENKIKIQINKKEKNILKKIEQYLNAIIEFLEEKKENLKSNHIKILKNLLISNKSKDALKDFHNLNKKTIFTIRDFIINYSIVAIEKLFNNKLEEFKQKDSDELKNLYLFFIFQIKDTENIKKLKIFIYTYLYEEKDINKFIEKSSEEIVKKGTVDNVALRNFETKYNELNIIIKNVSNELITFFGRDLKKNNSDLLKFFNPESIINNYNYLINDNIEITENKIVIDDLNYDKNKIHLFSPEFLIINGLKSKYEDNDFKIFNKDFYSVDLFSKFLLKLIDEINKCIEQNDYKNDFIIKHLFNLYKKKLGHYIISKFDYNDKIDINESINKNNSINPFIKIKIYQNKNYYDNNSMINNDLKSKDNSSKDNKSLSNKNSYLNKSENKSKVSSANSFTETIYKISQYFENLINNKLIENVEKDKLVILTNILFMLNLKIPEYNKKTNSIDYKSVHLDYFSKNEDDKNNKTIKYYSGFKEIDSVFQNNSKKFIEVGDLKYFHVNLKFVKNYYEYSFNLNELKEEKFFIYSDSIFFCEIKNSFPNTSRGNKDYLNRIVIKPKKLKNPIVEEQLEGLIPYCEELEKLIRKFFFFFDIYKTNKDKKIPSNIQIVLLYDLFNVDEIDPNFTDIKEVTKNTLDYYFKRFENRLNIIFQLIFFDYNKLNEDRDKKIVEQQNEIMEKESIIKNQKDEIKNQKDEIKNQNNKIVEKEKTIQNLTDQIKKEKEKIEELKKDTKLTKEEKWNLFMDFLNKE